MEQEQRTYLEEDLESLQNQLAELKKLRNNLTADQNDKKEEVIEEPIKDNAELKKYAKETLDSLDVEIKGIEEELKKTAKEYDKAYKSIQLIDEQYEKATEGTNILSEEELADLRNVTETKKLKVNELSNIIKKNLDNQRKIISDLKRKKTQIENNISKAEALDLSYDEYKNVTSTLRKTSIMNAILEEKGLSPIIAKRKDERTEEENNLLKETKKEILNEISEFKADKEYDDYSVLDTIEALYSLETKYIKVEEPRKTNEFVPRIMMDSTLLLPHRIIRPDAKENTNVIEEIETTPEDMIGAGENEKVDINELKPAEEKVTLFKDTNTDNYYVKKYAVDKFKLKSADLGNEVKINESVCYKISENDVNRIKENANNTFSPYIADIKEIALEDTKEEAVDLGENIEIEAAPIEETKDEVEISDEEISEIRENIEEEDTAVEKEELEEDIVENVQEVVPAIPEIDIQNEVSDAYKEELNKEEINDIYKEELNKDEIDDIYKEGIELAEDGSIISTKEDEKEELSEDDIVTTNDEEIKPAIPEIDTETPLDEIADIYKEELDKVEEYEPIDLEASEDFKNELRDGDVLYNIVHKVPRLAKDPIKKAENEIDAMIEESEEKEDDKPRQK